MRLQTDGVLKETSKAEFRRYWHSSSGRWNFAWFPKKLITKLNFNEIEIPYWYWKKLRNETS